MINRSIYDAEKFLEEFGALDFYDLFLDSFGFPEDTTADKKYNKYFEEKDESVLDKDFYCRDYLYDVLYDYSSSEISFKECEKKLEKELKFIQKY